ncbi:MAG: 4'-phosphopantetheinyl transferase family protein [Candidatus Helarchaeota archaeon]
MENETFILSIVREKYLFQSMIKKRNELFPTELKKKPISMYLVNLSIFKNIEKQKNVINLIKKNKQYLGNLISKAAIIDILKFYNIENISPSNIFITRLESGQPNVKLKKINFNKGINISMSHKDDLYLAAAGEDSIGIDIEKRRIFNQNMIEKIFNPQEIINKMDVNRHVSDARIELDENLFFTCLFSLKESVSKALGKGLKLNFRNMQINLNEPVINIEYQNSKGDCLHFIGIIMIKNGYIISLVERK